MQRQQYYKLFQVAKKQLNMDDDSYRALLYRCGATNKQGKISATTLSPLQLENVLQEFKHLGFMIITPKPAQDSHGADAMRRKLNLLWVSLGEFGVVRNPELTALEKWARRYTKHPLRDATPRELNIMIEALKKWGVRSGLKYNENGRF
jgi:phage gp16-like protein